MKILLQTPTAPGGDVAFQQRLRGLMLSALDGVKREDSELVFNPSTAMHDMRGFAELGERYRNDAVILDNLLIAAADRTVDAVIVHCFWDSALWPARQMLDKPVVGLAEAAMSLAAYVGRRFAIISVSPRYDQGVEDLVRLNGFRERAIDYRPARSIAADETQCLKLFREGRLDEIMPDFLTVARACIEDGADVLILGCGLVSILLREVLGIRELDGVPIITPIIAAVKSTESLVDMHKAGLSIKSRRGYWGSY